MTPKQSKPEFSEPRILTRYGTEPGQIGIDETKCPMCPGCGRRIGAMHHRRGCAWRHLDATDLLDMPVHDSHTDGAGRGSVPPPPEPKQSKPETDYPFVECADPGGPGLHGSGCCTPKPEAPRIVACATCEKAHRAVIHMTDECHKAGHTPRAIAQEPRVVAVCWTCAYTDLNLDGSKQREVKPAELYANRLWNEADKHRAAGHDVRPVREVENA